MTNAQNRRRWAIAQQKKVRAIIVQKPSAMTLVYYREWYNILIGGTAYKAFGG